MLGITMVGKTNHVQEPLMRFPDTKGPQREEKREKKFQSFPFPG